MKTPPTTLRRRRFLRLTSLLVTLPLCSVLRGADDRMIAAVRAADDERRDATAAGDRARLEAIYSDEVHYVHASGKNDTKASLIQGITTGNNKYERFEHKDRTFVAAGPGIVLMRGRVLVHLSNKQTGDKTVNDVNYLGVWREEKGKWRLLAWQASRNTPPADAKK